jgi:hypothetical protein
VLCNYPATDQQWLVEPHLGCCQSQPMLRKRHEEVQSNTAHTKLCIMCTYSVAPPWMCGTYTLYSVSCIHRALHLQPRHSNGCAHLTPTAHTPSSTSWQTTNTIALCSACQPHVAAIRLHCVHTVICGKAPLRIGKCCGRWVNLLTHPIPRGQISS